MKEFMNNHPWLTFWAFTAAVEGVVNVVKIVAQALTGTMPVETVMKEENTNESSGDIQKCDESDK